MKTYFVLFAEAFLLAYVLTPLAIEGFKRWGLVDKPDGVRKLHPTPVPRLGGPVLVFCAAVTLGSLWMIPNELGWLLRVNAPTMAKFLLPGLLIMAVGILDDIRPLPSLPKFALQVLAASWVWFQGISITIPYASADSPTVALALSVASYVATVVWIVGITNAINLIDGMDGLAAGIAFLSSTTMVVSAMVLDTPAVTLLMLPISGALLAFLRYNFNPARIFLGDSGSTFLGFILAAAALVYMQKKATLIAITMPFMALGLPIADTSLSIVRRLIRGTPVLGGDHGHVHHRLVGLGLTPRRAVIVLYGVSVLFTGLALVSMFATRFAATVVIVLFCTMVISGVRLLRYPEFQEATSHLGKGFVIVSRQARNHIAFRELCEELRQAASIEEIEATVKRVAELLAFDGFRLTLSDQLAAAVNLREQVLARDFSHARDLSTHPELFWLVTIPFGAEPADRARGNSLTLYRKIGKGEDYFSVDLLVDSLASELDRAFQRTAANAFSATPLVRESAGGS